MARPVIDLTGEVFGRLVVVERGEDGSTRGARWICRCECGEMTTVYSSNLRAGGTRSCGCYSREAASARATGNTYCVTHGHAKGSFSPTYRSWRSMKVRCFNSDADNYEFYGGRGITVCTRWLDFENFLTDMGLRPEGTSLDRIDGNGDYGPDNCRWATRSQQASNRRPRRSPVR